MEVTLGGGGGGGGCSFKIPTQTDHLPWQNDGLLHLSLHLGNHLLQ